MNHSRGWLSRGKPLGLAPACLSIAFFVAGIDSGLAVWEGPSPHTPQALEGDFLAGGNQRAAPDLLLNAADTAKAGALAAFSEALIAEDNAESDKALEDYQKALSLDPGYTELAVKVAFELQKRGDPSAGIQVLKDSIKASPKSPLAYVYLSQLYEKDLGKPDVGLKYALQALDLDPTNFASYVAVYQIYQDTNQPHKALDVLDRAARLGGTDPQFWLQLGEFYLKAVGDGPIPPVELEKIAAIFRKALSLNGNDTLTLARVADFYARTHQEKEAIPIYLKALKFSPANAPDGDQNLATIRDSLARCFIAVDNTADAISTLQRLIKDNPLRYESYELLFNLYYEKTDDSDAALAVCQQMMLLDQSDFRNYIRAAEILMRQGKMDAAIQTLSDARVKFPAEADVTCFLGIALTAGKRYHEAIGIFEQAVDEASQGETEMLDSRFYFAYATAAEQAGQLDKAVELIKKAIQLDPKSAEAYNYLGEVLIKQGKMDAAIQTLKDARVKFPSEPGITSFLGIALASDKRYREALGIFEQAVQEAGKGKAEMLDGQFYFAYGTAAEQAGQFDKAVEFLKKAIQLDPKSAEPYNYLGYMWIDRGVKLDEAGDLIKKALQFDPKNPAYIDSLGWYYFKKGDLKQAVETLKKAAALIQPEDAIVDEHAGDACSASNDTAHALEYWQRAAAIDKDNKEIAVKIAGAREKLARQGPPVRSTP